MGLSHYSCACGLQTDIETHVYKNINYTLCIHTRIYYILYFLLCIVCTYSTLFHSGSYCGLAGLPCLQTKVEGVRPPRKRVHHGSSLELQILVSGLVSEALLGYFKLLRSEQKID